MSWVIDGSLALAWALPDEQMGSARNFLKELSPRDILWVPALWWYEIANGLVSAQRRRRITEADSSRLLQVFARLPLAIDPGGGHEIAWRLVSLSRNHALSAYDAAYLELAQRRGLSLASLDKQLCSAAKAAGVNTL